MPRTFRQYNEPDTSDRFAAAFGDAGQVGSQLISQHLIGKQEEANKQKLYEEENRAILEQTGIDLTGIRDQKSREEAFKQAMQQKMERRLYEDMGLIEPENRSKPNMTQLDSLEENDLDNTQKPSLKKPRRLSAVEKGILGSKKPAMARALQHEEDLQQRKDAATSAETSKIKEEIVQKANSARRGIQNKHRLLDIVKRGNIDDPSWAMFAEALPFNIGQRLLSPDTVTYKAGLIDEYNVLRNLFQGATRVKELEIAEKKLADLYYTDEQKEAVLKSGADSLQLDILREQAAQEVDSKNPGLGLFEFNKKVNELYEEKADQLFNRIMDDQNAIISQAERRKNTPLNPDDPDDKQIMQQILIEAGGNADKALILAKKKGYKF